MHQVCGVSTCQIPTQDRICGVHTRDVSLNLKLLCVEHGGGPSLLEELDVVITRQAKIVGVPIGIVVHNNEPRLPFHDAASNLRIEVYRELATLGVIAANHNPHLQRVQRTPVEVGIWLSSRPGFLSNLPDAGAMVEAMKRRRMEVEKMIDRPPTMVMLGNCATPTDDGAECTRHLYAALDDDNRPPAFITCPQCGTEHDVLTRQRALISEGRKAAGTASEVSRVLSRIGIVVAASTIRGYAQARVSRGVRYEPRVQPVDVTLEGHPLYSIQQTMDVWLQGQMKKGKAA